MDSTLIDLQNPWWQDDKAMDRDPHIRAITGKSYRFKRMELSSLDLQSSAVHIIRGPRQVGKTTLIKELIASELKSGFDPRMILYLSCETLGDFGTLQKVLVEWINSHTSNDKAMIFLDEVSFVKEWQRAVLSLSNLGFLERICMVITGSNARDLKESSERLPGRRGKGKDLFVYPLGPKEYGQLDCFKGLTFKQRLGIYLQVGGFPHAIRDYHELGQVSDETYITYRNWIIGDAARYRLSEEFLKSILYRISETLGTRVSWSELIKDTSVKSHETALEYVEHLEDSFLTKVLYCYDPDKKSSALHKARKIYLIDPLLYFLSRGWKGSASNFFQLGTSLLEKSKFKGHLLESATVCLSAQSKSRNFYFWYSTKQKKEVDLVEVFGNELNLYDVTSCQQKPYKALNQKVEVIDPDNLEKHLSSLVLDRP